MTPAETPAEILKAARAKIEKPENWTQRRWAVDYHGGFVWPRNHAACKWCGEGAVTAVAPSCFSEREAVQYLNEVVAPFGATAFARFNDTHTHPEVLQMFDLAIEKAEGRG